MKNFIFKSTDADLQKIVSTILGRLDVILKEQAHQRCDLADIKRLLIKEKTDHALQKQVDDYFEEGRPQDD